MEKGGADISYLEKFVYSLLDEEKFWNSEIDFALVTVEYPSLKPLELNLPEQRTRNVILRTDRIVMFGQHRSSPVILRTTRLCGTPPD